MQISSEGPMRITTATIESAWRRPGCCKSRHFWTRDSSPGRAMSFRLLLPGELAGPPHMHSADLGPLAPLCGSGADKIAVNGSWGIAPNSKLHAIVVASSARGSE